MHGESMNAMDDFCYFQFKKHIIPLINNEKTLLITEGGNRGLVKPGSDLYKELVQRVNRYLLQYCLQQKNVDLLVADPRSPVGFQDNLNWFIKFSENIEKVSRVIDLTCKVPKNLTTLENMIQKNKISWEYKDSTVVSNELRSFKESLPTIYKEADVCFLKQIEDYQDKYNHVILVTGFAHYFHIRQICTDSDIKFSNLTDSRITTPALITKAYACFYL